MSCRSYLFESPGNPRLPGPRLLSLENAPAFLAYALLFFSYRPDRTRKAVDNEEEVDPGVTMHICLDYCSTSVSTWSVPGQCKIRSSVLLWGELAQAPGKLWNLDKKQQQQRGRNYHRVPWKSRTTGTWSDAP